jgi:hypothetical protein
MNLVRYSANNPPWFYDHFADRRPADRRPWTKGVHMSVKRLVAPLAGGALAAAAAIGFATVSPVAPTANASGTWAAIAVSPENEVSGVASVYSASSKAEAEKAAMDNCVNVGNTQCQIAISAYHGCIAVADSPDAWAEGAGDSIGEAESNALSANGGGTILESLCTGA